LSAITPKLENNLENKKYWICIWAKWKKLFKKQVLIKEHFKQTSKQELLQLLGNFLTKL